MDRFVVCFDIAYVFLHWQFTGNKALELEKEGYKVIFCFEEAIGYMCNSKVVDKDGVSALANFTCLANYVYGNGMQLCDQLDQIYDKYGLHVSLNSYYFCYEPPKIERIFDRIRNFTGTKSVCHRIWNS